MNPADRLEAMEATLEDLREANAELPVVVEGDRDETSLRALGLHGQIVRLNQGISVHALCERLAAAHPQVIVLTDWDRKGGQLGRLLREGLAANGARADMEFRRRLAALAHVRTVEGLAGWMATLRASAAPPGSGPARGPAGP